MENLRKKLIKKLFELSRQYLSVLLRDNNITRKSNYKTFSKNIKGKPRDEGRISIF